MLNPIQSLRGFLKRREQTAKKRSVRTTRLAIETLEGRRVLASSGALPAIMGTVFADANSNNTVEAGEEVPGATVVLWVDDGDGVFNSVIDTQVGAPVTTDANGEYCFDNLNPDDDYFVEQLAQTVGGTSLPQTVSAEVSIDPQLNIDTFETTQSTIALPPPVSDDDSSLALITGEVIGGERDLAVELQAGTSEVQLRVNPFGLDDVFVV